MGNTEITRKKSLESLCHLSNILTSSNKRIYVIYRLEIISIVRLSTAIGPLLRSRNVHAVQKLSLSSQCRVKRITSALVQPSATNSVTKNRSCDSRNPVRARRENSYSCRNGYFSGLLVSKSE